MKPQAAIALAAYILLLTSGSAFSSVRNDQNAPSPVVENAIGRARIENLEKAISGFNESIALNLAGPVPYSKMPESPMPAQDVNDVILACTAALSRNPNDADLLVYRGMAHSLNGEFKEAIEDFSSAIQINPSRADAFAQRAATKLALADYEGGIADYSAALLIRPDDSALWSLKAAALGDQVLARNNLDPDSRFAQNHVTWRESDFAESMRNFQKAMDQNPNDYLAYLLRGFLKTGKGDNEGALGDLRKAVELSPGSTQAWNALAVALDGTRDFDASVETSNRVLAIAPENRTAFNNRGVAKMNGGMDGAMEDFSRAIAIDPTYANAYINRGVARVAKGDFSEAIQDFTHAMDHATKRVTYSAALSGRAEAKIKNGDADGGMKDFAAIIAADPKNFEPYATRALARIQLRDLKGAEEDITRAMKLNPDAGYCYLVRGALKTAKGDLPEAIKDYDTALKLNPKDEMVLINRAMAWNSLREWNKSIADCERVLSQKPDPVTAAQVHFIKGASIEGRDCDYQKVAVELQKAVALDPRHDLAHWKLGVGKVHLQDQEGAMSEFNKALEINPHNAPALADRGLLKGVLRDFSGALTDIESAITENPKEARFYGYRGSVKHEMGDFDAAIADYERSLAMEPRDDTYRTLLQKAKIAKSSGGGSAPNKEYNSLLDEAVARTKAGDRSGAVELLEKAVLLDPKAEPAYVFLASTRCDSGNLSEALTLIDKAITIEPNDFQAHQLRALIHIKSNQPQEAMSDLTRTIGLNPKNGIAYLYRAVIKGNANDFQGCSEDLDHAALLLPGHPDIPILRKNLEAKRNLAPAKSPVDPAKNAEVEKIVEAAWNMASQGNLDGALAEGNRALALNPSDSRTHTFLARVKNARGDAAGALSECDQALAIEPNNFMAYSIRSMIKIDKADWSGVIEDSTKALAITPQDVFSYLNRGKAKANIRDLDGALTDYNRGIAMLNPPDPRAFAERGMVKAAKGDWNGAISDYNEALSLAPNDPNLITLKDKAKAHQL